MPSIGEKRKCPDCGSMNLKIESINGIRDVRVMDFPVTRCRDCREVSLTDISRAVYDYFRGNRQSAFIPYEEACIAALDCRPFSEGGPPRTSTDYLSLGV
jgi:hypothetical protein